MAPGRGIFFVDYTDRGGLVPAAFLRVPLAVAPMAERDSVAQTVRKVRSLTDRFDVVCNVCRYHPAIPLAVLTEVLIPAHDRCRPITVSLFVVRRVR